MLITTTAIKRGLALGSFSSALLALLALRVQDEAAFDVTRVAVARVQVPLAFKLEDSP